MPRSTDIPQPTEPPVLHVEHVCPSELKQVWSCQLHLEPDNAPQADLDFLVDLN